MKLVVLFALIAALEAAVLVFLVTVGEDPASWPTYGQKVGIAAGVEVWRLCDRTGGHAVFVSSTGSIAVVEDDCR